MTEKSVGAQQPDGSVLHTEEAIVWSLQKAAQLCEDAGLTDAPKILRDLAARRTSWPPR